MRLSVLFLLLAILLASALLYLRPTLHSSLQVDDFQILAGSWTWERTRDSLWVPQNEHFMPLGRLTTWLLIQIAGRQGNLPLLCSLQGPLALLLGIPLLYLFVRRELGSPFLGLVAAAVYGISSVYGQAVVWFAASFSILTLDTLLLALLAAQSWRQSQRLFWLVLCAVACALAPTWFASGFLVGPLCALYLLWPSTRPGEPVPSGLAAVKAYLRQLPFALAPLTGTALLALFLRIILPRTIQYIMHLEHYGDGDAVKSFKPLIGLDSTYRSVVENLFLGSFGIGSVDVPRGLVWLAWTVVLIVGVWWWRGAGRGRGLILVGTATIFMAYLLVYSARAEWRYENRMNQPNWTRYHLLPQLGLALVLVGGLARWPRFSAETLSRWHLAMVAGLIGTLFVLQVPRIFLTTLSEDSTEQLEGLHRVEAVLSDPVALRIQAEQLQALRRVEAVDAVCRREGISAGTAIAAMHTKDGIDEPEWWEQVELEGVRRFKVDLQWKELGAFDIPGCQRRINGWRFLWGSAHPDPNMTVDRARVILRGEESQ